MSHELTVDLVGRLYRTGVESVQMITAGFSDEAWELPACGHWNGTETARHLLAVARWYHAWLDRAIAGDASPPFPLAEMDQRNEAALADIGDMPGPEAIAEFAAAAASYLGRAAEHWTLPFGYPRGTVTVGLHCGVAATEWHLHAWDLSHAAARRHEPEDAEALFVAAGTCLAEAQGGLRGATLRALVPIGARRNPWQTILKRSGRNSRL